MLCTNFNHLIGSSLSDISTNFINEKEASLKALERSQSPSVGQRGHDIAETLFHDRNTALVEMADVNDRLEYLDLHKIPTYEAPKKL